MSDPVASMGVEKGGFYQMSGLYTGGGCCIILWKMFAVSKLKHLVMKFNFGGVWSRYLDQTDRLKVVFSGNPFC